MQPRPFEEWIEKRHHRDANLCGACARLTDERSLVRGGGEYNQGSFVYSAKHCFWQVSDSVCTTVLTLSQKKKTTLRAVFLLDCPHQT